MDIESFIKNLSPELQEKARACDSVEELLALAKESKVPVPDEVLSAIAGGDQPDPENCQRLTCPKCGSNNCWQIDDYRCKCFDCGYVW